LRVRADGGGGFVGGDNVFAHESIVKRGSRSFIGVDIW
jgi:hypothetical protein